MFPRPKSTLRAVLRAQLRVSGTVAAAARSLGLSEAALRDLLRGLGMVRPEPPALEQWFRAA